MYTLENTKKMIIQYVLRAEANHITINTPPITKRLVQRYMSRFPEFKQAYQDLISIGAIHEAIDGGKHYVREGKAQTGVMINPQAYPYCSIDHDVFNRFVVRIIEHYERKGWSDSSIDMKREISNALESYQPIRPY